MTRKPKRSRVSAIANSIRWKQRRLRKFQTCVATRSVTCTARIYRNAAASCVKPAGGGPLGLQPAPRRFPPRWRIGRDNWAFRMIGERLPRSPWSRHRST